MEQSASTDSTVTLNHDTALKELFQTVGPEIMDEIVNNYNMNHSCDGNTSPDRGQEMKGEPVSPEHYQTMLHQWGPEESIGSQDMCRLYTGECYTSVYNSMIPCSVGSSPEQVYWPQYQAISPLPHSSPVREIINPQTHSLFVNSDLQQSFTDYYNYGPSPVVSHVPANVKIVPIVDQPAMMVGAGPNPTSDTTSENANFWSKFCISTNDQYKENLCYPTTAKTGCVKRKHTHLKIRSSPSPPCSVSQTMSSSKVCTYVMMQRDNLVTVLTPTGLTKRLHDTLDDSGIGSDIATPPSLIQPRKIQSCQISSTTVISPPPDFSLPLVPGNTKLNIKTSKPIKRKANNSETCKSEAKKPRHNEPLNDCAINVMLRWYERHQEKPYPTKQEKEMMSRDGNISMAQVKSWFANKRNRSNNTRPKVQKRKMQEKLLNICQQLSTDSKQPLGTNTQIIQQLSCLINQSQQKTG